MSIIDDVLGTVINPGRGFEGAQKKNQAGWNEAKGFLQPYQQNGLEQYPMLSDAFKQLLDPTGLQNKWMGAYEQSPMAKQALEQNTNVGRDEASSMGLNGSSAALANIQQGAGNIAGQDKQHFIENMMKQYMNGIGLGSNLYGTGATAAGALASGAQQFGENQGQLEYGRKMAPWDLWNAFGDKVGAAMMGGMGGMGGGAGAMA